MSDILPDNTTPLTEEERVTRVGDWSDFRKDYGVSPDDAIRRAERRAFDAGWNAHRNGLAGQR